MEDRKKIVLIGAGSAMFTQGFVMDLIKNPGPFKWHLSLVDTDEKALDIMMRLCTKIIAYKEADIKLTGSVNRLEELNNADYVVSTVGVGGRRAWEKDVFIPRKYGIYQPVGDTAMPGGLSRAMRMVPAMIDIARDVGNLCPDAQFFNYSNPMTIICRSIVKGTDVPVTGLCIGVPGSAWYIAETAGMDKNKISYRSIGVNHLSFIYSFRHEGRDAWPVIHQKIDELRDESFDTEMNDRFFAENKNQPAKLGEPFSWEFFKKYNAYPAPGDRHITEFFTHLFPEGNYYNAKLGVDAYSFEGTIAQGDRIYQRVEETAYSDSDLTEEFFSHIHGEHEQLMEIIRSIELDERRVYTVNMPNHGAVRSLPWDAVLELPAVAGASGFSQIHVDDLPGIFSGLLMKHLGIAELASDAALKGDKKLFVEAVMMGGYISDYKTAEKLVDELLTAQKEYLPQF